MQSEVKLSDLFGSMYFVRLNPKLFQEFYQSNT